MTNWAEKSDFELSCAVLEKHKPEYSRRLILARGSTSKCWCRNYLDVFDINNWADMGPVIEENFDKITKATGYEGEANWDDKIYMRDDCGMSLGKISVLRAAAICYLEAV